MRSGSITPIDVEISAIDQAMRRLLRFLNVVAIVAGLVAAGGCAEGQYQFEYHGTVLRCDGVTPAAGVRLLPCPAKREGIFGARFSADDRHIVVSDGDGRFNGTMSGWFASPLLWPFPPQECKADKVWVYLLEDAERNRWKAVVVPVRAKKTDKCKGVIDDVRVALPAWHAGCGGPSAACSSGDGRDAVAASRRGGYVFCRAPKPVATGG